jgi:glycosyltransferase involved in cell wall biosynthesis
MMKLAVISTVKGFRWAGTEEVWYGMALCALQAGHAVTAYIHKDLQGAEQIASLTAKGAQIHTRRTFSYSRLWPVKEKLAPTFPQSQLNAFDAILLSAGSLVDVLYVPGLLEALRQTKTPYALFCQFNAECLAFSPQQRVALRQFVEGCAGCCFVSQQNLQLAERQLAMKLPAAKVIWNPVRQVLAGPLPWPEGSAARFACVARLETLWKGQDLLFEILSQPPWPSRDWNLSLFGEGPDLDHLKNAAKFFNLGKRVEFRGYVRSLEAIWKEHHVLLMPSRGEGLPLAVLEAMMCGRPAVVTDAGENRLVLEDGVTGFIAETATPYSFGKTLERAWAGQSGWAQMGQSAHRRAREMASADPSGRLLEYVVERGSSRR